MNLSLRSSNTLNATRFIDRLDKDRRNFIDKCKSYRQGPEKDLMCVVCLIEVHEGKRICQLFYVRSIGSSLIGARQNAMKGLRAKTSYPNTKLRMIASIIGEQTVTSNDDLFVQQKDINEFYSPATLDDDHYFWENTHESPPEVDKDDIKDIMATEEKTVLMVSCSLFKGFYANEEFVRYSHYSFQVLNVESVKHGLNMIRSWYDKKGYKYDKLEVSHPELVRKESACPWFEVIRCHNTTRSYEEEYNIIISQDILDNMVPIS